MTKEETAQLAEDIGKIAEDIILQLNKYKIKPSYIEEFYLGLLIRERTILRDASFILRNNPELQLTSVFILLRVLLDDFIRLFSVYAKNDEMEEEIIKIHADAHNHRFKNIKKSLEINIDYFEGKHESLSTEEVYEREKNKFLGNSEFDKFFKNKTLFRFKKIGQISDVFELMKNDVKTAANVHSYVVYKFLTQHVHYSNLTYYLDSSLTLRKVEIVQIEEILLYAIKMLIMQFDYFQRNYEIEWNDTRVSNYFNQKTNEI